MTTAHRPTWAPAKGGEEQGGMRIFAPSKQQSVKDMPSQTRLKFRQDGQNKAEELRKKDLRAELEEKERKHLLKSKDHNFEAEREEDLRLLESAAQSHTAEPPRLVPRAADADDADADDADEDPESSSESEDDDDEEDEEAELLAELARIKAERAEEAARKAAEEAAKVSAVEEAALLGGNPLLKEKLQGQSADGSFAIKRSWDDDVVFRNQTRGEPKAQKRFINDTIRSDFHRRFLEKYVR